MSDFTRGLILGVVITLYVVLVAIPVVRDAQRQRRKLAEFRRKVRAIADEPAVAITAIRHVQKNTRGRGIAFGAEDVR